MGNSKAPRKRKRVKGSTCFLCGGQIGSEGGYEGLKVDGLNYSIRFCSSCGLGVTSPFVDDKRLKEIYSSTYRGEDSTRFFSPLEKLIRVVRVQRARRVEKYASKGKVLDVGCGRGDFPALMASRGWDATGIELDERIERREAGKKGLHLRFGRLEDVSLPAGRFDAVTMWHVFEHMKDPAWVMGECSRILKPGGLLMLAVPNTGSLQARLSGRHWFHLDPPYHFYHYTLENMKTLMEGAGFEVLSVKHFSLEYNPYGVIQSVFNMFGFRPNLFYDFLRSRSAKDLRSTIGVALMALSLPVVVPFSMALCFVESALRKGGTIEVYARKKQKKSGAE